MSRITFNYVKAKNFRSIDNQGMELHFEQGNTLVGSLDNGAGKSTMLVYALYYALYDKAYGDKQSKTQLINSRSGKECVVECEFSANGSVWYIKRGMKPTVFEIHKDGVPIVDEAALSQHQKNIDKVLGMDEKVFCNTVALGKDKFVPFITMSAGERRNYGEQMLDLTVISVMNELNKADIKLVTLELSQQTAISMQREQEIAGLLRVVDVKKSHAQQALEGVDEEIAAETKTANGLKADLTTQDAIYAQSDDARVSNRAKLQEKQKYENMLQQVDAAIADLETTLLKGITSTDCPSCGQCMPEQHRLDKIAVAEEKLANLKSKLPALKAKIAETPDGLESAIQAADKVCADAGTAIAGIRARLSVCLDRMRTLTEKKRQAEQSNDWAAEEQQIAEARVKLDAANANISTFNTKMRSHEVMAASLRDDGVKAKIAEVYIPYLNERINTYLRHMNLFVNVSLDSEFDIVLQSPDRKGQDVFCLSTGQQGRINLSILLAWRDIARATSSCDANILILDEVLENLSEQGVEEFVEMFRMLDEDKTSLYVITQRRSEFSAFFDKTLTYKLEDDHTVIHAEE